MELLYQIYRQDNLILLLLVLQSWKIRLIPAKRQTNYIQQQKTGIFHLQLVVFHSLVALILLEFFIFIFKHSKKNYMTNHCQERYSGFSTSRKQNVLSHLIPHIYI